VWIQGLSLGFETLYALQVVPKEEKLRKAYRQAFHYSLVSRLFIFMVEMLRI
jgi:hypothetical protein